MECFSVAFLRNLRDNYNDILNNIFGEKYQNNNIEIYKIYKKLRLYNEAKFV